MRLNPEERSPEKARALWALSMILNWQGDVVAARPVAEQSLELWRENGDPLELALALEGIGWLHFSANNYAEALRSMEDCVESYRKLGSAKLITRGRVAVGQMLVALGDVEAHRTARDGKHWRRVARRMNRSLSITHFIISRTVPCGGATPGVRWQLYGESLRAALDYGNEMEAAMEMQGMAMGLMGSGREDEGLRLYGASNARFAELQTTFADEVLFWMNFRERYVPPARETNGSDRLGRGGRRGTCDGLAESFGVCISN